MTNSKNKSISQLRDEFVKKLPQRFASIKELFDQLSPANWDESKAEQLHLELHSINGAAGIYGYMDISNACQMLEVQFNPQYGKKIKPEQLNWKNIGADFERLEKIINNTQADSVPFLRKPEENSTGKISPLVYVVEDEPEQAEFIENILNRNGYQVSVFSSPDAFRENFNKAIPAVVIMDLIFPEGDDVGVELIREMGLGRDAGIPVIVVSIRDDIEARLAAFREGACRFLNKPFNEQKLVNIVDLLSQRQPHDAFRVLLVDDDQELLDLESAVLESAGMNVYSLTDPLRTIEVAEKFKPDVIVLDVYMPGASGPELAAILRERDSYWQLPILFLSAETDISQQLMALNLGGDDFLVKPVKPEHFISAVSSRARRYRQEMIVQKQLEQTLYEREREHLALDRHAIVSIADSQGNIIHANDMFCKVSGYTREELIGNNHRIVKSNIHPDEFYQDMWKTICSGKTWHGDVCNRSKDGSLYWVATTITPFLDEDGLPYQYVSIRTDITENKDYQIALRKLIESTTPVTGQTFFDNAVEGLASITGAKIGFISLLDQQDKSMFRTVAFWNSDRVGDNFSYPVKGTPCEKILDGKTVLFKDRVDDCFPDDVWLKDNQVRSYLAIPLRCPGSDILGHMGIMDSAPLNDSSISLSILQLFADRVASELLRINEEKLVQQHRDRLQETLESTADGILAVDNNGKLSFANRQFYEMWHIPEELRTPDQPDERLLEFAISQLHDPDSFIAKVKELYQSNKESYDELHFKNGQIIDRYSRPLVVENKLIGRLWSFRDVTERKQAELKVEQVKERLRRGQKYANIGTWEWNIQNGELYWSERIAPLFGYIEGEVETSYDNFLAAVHPDDRQAVTDAVNACVADDTPYEIEHRVIWQDGSEHWLLERGAVMRDKQGTPLQMLGVVQDISDRKKVELSLMERERQLREAQSLAHLGSWQADIITGELTWSDEIYRIFGHEPSSFEPSVDAFRSMVHPDDREKVTASEKLAEQTGLHNVVHRIILPDRSIRHVHELAQAEKDENGQLVRLTGTVQDITEEVEVKQALIEARDDAERANHAKSEFLSSMSHELRTPMNAILGFGQLLELDDSLSDSNHDSVAEILKAGQHLLSLINEVLDLAKIESGKIELSLEPVEIQPLAEACISLLLPLAERRDISISYKAAKNDVVRADYTRLKQVILNLLSNAIKYNRQGGKVELKVRMKDENNLMLGIRDTGPGIHPDEMKNLFKPFNRLHAENSEIEGTGIGLTLTLKIMQLMGGDVEVESEQGVGSTFWVVLPVESLHDELLVNDMDENTGDVTGIEEDADVDTYTVLYIEDNPANLKLVGQILAQRKHLHLISSHTPALGIELAEARVPDLILLDINLPGMNGYQVMEILKKSDKLSQIPVIALTANAMPRDIQRGREAGFTDYITKPIDIIRFNEAIDNCLESLKEQ